jgi:hypothetical protein
MKEFVIALIITTILIILFSISYLPSNLSKLGSTAQYHGDSGITIQGNGSEPAEIIVPEYQKKNMECDEAELEKVLETSDTKEINNKEKEFYMEEKSNMSEMLIAFWHGVAAILIGEVAALAVAAMWTKIYDIKKKNV